MSQYHLYTLQACLYLAMSVASINSFASSDHHDHALEKHHAHEDNQEKHSKHEAHNEHGHHDEESTTTVISDDMIAMSQINTSIAGPKTLHVNDQLFGVINASQDKNFHIHATFVSMVEKVHVQIGDNVKKNQRLLTLKNIETLQRYTLTSPADGEVTERAINIGDRVENQSLLQVTDLSEVWVDMSAFPENIEKIKKGQKVVVRDMHQHESAKGDIIYVAPQMTGGHIARARAVINNPNGHWRPGMHIQATVEVAQREVPVAIRTTALQTLDGQRIAFLKHGNEFTAKPLSLGLDDGEYVEIISGLNQGDEYVSENSFIIKADLLKDGAAHHH